MAETKRAVKLGALLIGLEFISAQELAAIMDMASQVGMPLGRALVLSGKITDAELKIALQLHGLMRTADVPMETAKKCFSLVCYQGMPLLDALQKTGWTPSVTLPKEGSRLGKLLSEANLISDEQLREAQETSLKLGLPLGRILTLMGVVSHAVMLRVVDLQSMIRLGRLSHAEALEYLRADSSGPVAVGKSKSDSSTEEKPRPLIAEEPNTRHIRLGELLILAGLLTETDLMNAVELSLTRSVPLGAVLIQLGLITTDQLRLALTLQESIAVGALDVQSATDTLLMETGNSLIPKLTDVEPTESPKRSRLAEQMDAPKLRLGDLLKQCGFVNEEEIQSAIALARDYPSVIGRMLVINGYIDESVLLAGLRCQFMVRNKLISVDQAVKAMQYAKASKISFDDALDELGFYRHGKLEPA